MNKKYLKFTACLIILIFTPKFSDAAIIKVGPNRTYKTPSQAARIAKDGDFIEIDQGTYTDDVAVWRQNNLYIYGINGKPHLKSTGSSAEGKAIWVVKGNNTRIANIEFSGAKVRDRNGAGIRQEGTNLWIHGCFFHDNEEGILTGGNPKSEIIIENSEFARNGAGDGQSHNIYIGKVRKFTLRYSYVHHARIGHNVKSRALENHILYNRLMDENDGTSSYIIDLPNGGTSYIIGNLIEQGPKSENHTLLSFAAEGEKNLSKGFYIVNNSFINNHSRGKFIRNRSKSTPAVLINNIFYGPNDNILLGQGEKSHNLTIIKPFSLKNSPKSPGFVNDRNFDFHLKKNSPAIDAGIDPGSANGFSLVPQWQYKHVAGKEKRKIAGQIDIGAYEFIEVK